jgi:hypothetical protein
MPSFRRMWNERLLERGDQRGGKQREGVDGSVIGLAEEGIHVGSPASSWVEPCLCSCAGTSLAGRT